MKCVDIERAIDGDEPLFTRRADWIEIDHASDNVEEEVVIEEDVFYHFKLLVDPDDERNKWIKPRDGVVLLGEAEYDPEVESIVAFRYTWRFLAADGREFTLFYEDASVRIPEIRGGEHRIVHIEYATGTRGLWQPPKV